MTNEEFLMNVWEVNTAKKLAVQGEVNSRTLTITLIDRNGKLDSTSNADVENRPLDLTSKTIQLYIYKSDKHACLLDGVIKDAANGVAAFTLTEQATAINGEAMCEIWVSDSAGDGLKIIGLTLDIQPSKAVSIVSTNEFQALTKATAEAKVATAGALDVVQQTKDFLSRAEDVTAQATQAAQAAESAAEVAGHLPYPGEDGYWYIYDITTHAYIKTTAPAGLMYATFDIAPTTGILTMYTPENYKGAGFVINENGELEVKIDA